MRATAAKSLASEVLNRLHLEKQHVVLVGPVISFGDYMIIHIYIYIWEVMYIIYIYMGSVKLT